MATSAELDTGNYHLGTGLAQLGAARLAPAWSHRKKVLGHNGKDVVETCSRSMCTR